MTADDARDRVGEVREAMRRAMRSLSRPKPDWAGAARALDEANEELANLWCRCVTEHLREMRRGGRYGDR